MLHPGESPLQREVHCAHDSRFIVNTTASFGARTWLRCLICTIRGIGMSTVNRHQSPSCSEFPVASTVPVWLASGVHFY